jgi:hypothetical protein
MRHAPPRRRARPATPPRRATLPSLACLAGLAAPPLLFSPPARAESYVATPALGRSTVSFAILGGAPVDPSRAERAASAFGGGGSELAWGYAWESGIALSGVMGAARWSSRGVLAQTLRDRDASIAEAWGGVGYRHVIGAAELSPFYGASLTADWAWVRGAQPSDASGLAAAARVGLRWHEHPYDVFGALEARRAWLSAPYDDGDRLTFTRIAVVLGVGLDGPAR